MTDYTSNIPYGYCHCGCGQRTKIAHKNESRYGHVKGEPRRFINGHNRKAKNIPFTERFWSKVAITTNPDECWLWLAGTDPNGYGRFGKDNRNRTALSHRVSYELTYGEITDSLYVLHSCDNPTCCNPKHLFLGTQQDNMDDMSMKGRKVTHSSPGEEHPLHKLTANDVSSMRENRPATAADKRTLANRLGVTVSTINAVLRGRTWKSHTAGTLTVSAEATTTNS